MSRKIGHGASDRLDIDRDIKRLGGDHRGRTVTTIRRNTITGGARFRTLDHTAGMTQPFANRMYTIYGGKNLDTIYAGKRFDTIYAGKRFDTIYAGKRFDTIYAGKRFDTVYGGGGSGAITYWGAPRQGGGVTMTVKDPTTRQVVSVVYNPVTRQYLDTKAKRWLAAPAWMRAQLG
ncbi:MAG: hypothetical protein KDH15_00925 [Rhodocyclaceae bacterium]|nr:hypothetical protein [Rhodocyclaceae bacterium]